MLLGRTWLFSVFVMLKTKFSKHSVYIRPEVKKIYTTAMTTATNEACIGWIDENCYFMGKEWHFDSGRCKFIKEDFSGGENV